jgi:hypothetical protein
MSDTDTPTLSCPEHRPAALATLDLPVNSYYYCPTCDDEWCNDPGDSWRAYDYGMALLVTTWLAFQCGVALTFTLGIALVLRDNYGYADDSAVGYGTLYGFGLFIFWITILFPALWHLYDEIVGCVRHGLLNYPVPR